MEVTKIISGRQYATIGKIFFTMCVVKDFLEHQSNPDQPCINRLKYFESDINQLARTNRQLNEISSKCTKMRLSLWQSAVIHPWRHPPRISRWPPLFENSQKIRLLLYAISSENGPQECQNSCLICPSRKNYRLTTHLLQKSIMTLREWEQKQGIHQGELTSLSQLSRQFLCSPATSVPSESAFSTASFLGRKERARLSPTNLCFSNFFKDRVNDVSD